MPTRNQLHDIWLEQFELFDGFGIPRQIYDETMDGQGITHQKFSDSANSSKDRVKFSGEEIGTIKYFPDSGEQIFIPND